MMGRLRDFAVFIFFLCALQALFRDVQCQLEEAPCRPGTFLEDIFGKTPCVLCPRGTISTTVNANLCYKCPEGYTTMKAGSTECVPDVVICGRNSFVARSEIYCPRGTYFHRSTGRCETCPQGTFMFFTSMLCCFSCPLKETSTKRKGAWSPSECTTVPCVQDVRSNSSFKSLELEWDPVIFHNAKYVVKIAKKGTIDWYHFHLDEETTKLFVPGLEPGTEYKYKICVVAGTVTVECKEHCIKTLPCVQDVRSNSSFKSLELEWDPVIFHNAKYVVKIAKKGTSVWYHFHLDEETTRLFVPGLEPGTEYKYKICVVAGTVTVECEEHCISTLPLNLAISDTKGVIWERSMWPGCTVHIEFPECVNGTLILLQKLSLGQGGGIFINNALYEDTFDTDPPTVLYVPPNTSVEVRGGDVKRGEFKFFYTCAGLINVDAALIMMDDCTVRHCMKYDSFVEDLITIMTSKGNISFLLKKLCPFTTLFGLRDPVPCDECREPPSCPAPWGQAPADCPCQFGLHGPSLCKQYPSKPWNCTVGKTPKIPTHPPFFG